MPPLELVALVDENADLLPRSAEGETLQAHLADRLVALDLPERAGTGAAKADARSADRRQARAGFGARLAAMRLQEGDAAGALQALLASAGLGPARRRWSNAGCCCSPRPSARQGDVSAALAAIASLHSAAAAEKRAEILEQAQDWPGADRALTEYVAKIVPDSGAAERPAATRLLRLATAAARAGDDATLARLNARDSVRMGKGPLADMFHLLTAPPVRSAADLQRAQQEVGLARALPADLKALHAARALP